MEQDEVYITPDPTAEPEDNLDPIAAANKEEDEQSKVDTLQKAVGNLETSVDDIISKLDGVQETMLADEELDQEID
jgi:hypothetical protein